ncbi:prevent-host-death protein (plasmid) [Cereibacter azotoformans]|nr:prevent-host-death protein [Cereibacter azotoformans]UIJ33187.1 prevent-host-death protein [Cereibacter azotoformans]
MKRVLAALILTTALATPVAAQEVPLSGTVAEVFGTRIVLSTPEGRVLVTLPQGTTAPAPGTRLDLTGTRTGETFAATTVTEGPAAAPAEAVLPSALRGLDLTDIRTRSRKDGKIYIYARGGTGWLRAEARGDRLLEVQTDGAGLPQPLIETLLPAAVRAEPRLAEIARLTEIDLDDDGEISVEGFATDGMRIEIEFSRNGTLKDFERERDDRRSLSEAAAREKLVALGYTDIGFMERGGRHVTALATNPYGDTVEVRLDDQGRVERERLWQN